MQSVQVLRASKFILSRYADVLYIYNDYLIIHTNITIEGAEMKKPAVKFGNDSIFY